MRNGRLYEHPTRVPRTGGNGSSLLPSPHANCSTGPGSQGRQGGMNLQTLVATLLPTPTSQASKHAGTPDVHAKGFGSNLWDLPHMLMPTPNARDGKDAAFPPSLDTHRPGATDKVVRAVHHGLGAYAPALERWGAILGRPAPGPTQAGRDGRPRLSPRFVEWMMGLPEDWVGGPLTQQLKLLGNGVVPQQAALALQVLDC